MRLLFLLSACGVDNTLDGKDRISAFDSGDELSGTDDTSAPDDQDSGDTGEAATCAGRDLPAYALPEGDICTLPYTLPSWAFTVAWQSSGFNTMLMSSPVVGRLVDDNGDGVLDELDSPYVVATDYSGQTRAFRGTDGVLLWQSDLGGMEGATPAVGDLDGDGTPEVFVGTLTKVYALNGEDGTLEWESEPPTSTKTDGGATGVADLDGDGLNEAFMGRKIYDGRTGAVLAEGSYGYGDAIPGEGPISIAADIDLDGLPEIIVGNAAYRADGSALWNNDAGDGAPAAANLDEDPELEVVSAGMKGVTLADDDGAILWTVLPDGASWLGPPAIADLDGDGAPEILVGTGVGALALDEDGTLLWSLADAGPSMYAGVSAYDLDGDGAFEALVLDATGVRVLDGATGAKLGEYKTGNAYACGNYPVVADIDMDGQADILTVDMDGGYHGTVVVLHDKTGGYTSAGTEWPQHGTAVDDRSYRAGAAVSGYTPAVELAPSIRDVCLDACGAGDVTAWYSLANSGADPLTADVGVAIYGIGGGGEEVLLATDTWSEDVPSGWAGAGREVRLHGVPHPLYDLVVRVDGAEGSGTSALVECDDETNNVVSWGAALCP